MESNTWKTFVLDGDVEVWHVIRRVALLTSVPLVLSIYKGRMKNWIYQDHSNWFWNGGQNGGQNLKWRCRLAAGAGCTAFVLRVSPCSKAVRCSSPTPWDAAFSWRLGMGPPDLGDSRPARPEVRPAALSEHVCSRLQHGPLPALLVSLAGPPVPCIWLPWPPKRPQEGPHWPTGGLSYAWRLVLLGPWLPGGPDPGQELSGAAGQVLGILQGWLVCVACCAAGEFPLRAPPVPNHLHQRPDARVGHLPLLPEIPDPRPSDTPRLCGPGHHTDWAPRCQTARQDCLSCRWPATWAERGTDS